MEHTKKFGGDLSAICADLRAVQEASGHKVVRLAPRKLKPAKASRQRRESREDHDR
jgi:transposase